MKVKSKGFLFAIALLLISATLLGTASFAWFSMNTQVDVDGIEVEAYSDALFLEISEDNSDYDTSVTLTTGGKKTLRLVTPISTSPSSLITTAYNINAVAASGYYNGESVTYYAKGSVEGNDDTYSTNNYIKVNGLVAGDDISSLYALEISNDADAIAENGVVYCRLNNAKNGYTVVTVAEGAALAGNIRVLTVKNYFEYDSSAETYTLVKLFEGDSLDGLYEAVFTKTGDADVAAPAVDYYTYADGVYTKAQVSEGASVANHYTVSATACTSDDIHPALFSFDGSSEYTLATPNRGSSLDGLYTIDQTEAAQFVEIADLTQATGRVYIPSGDDFVCVYSCTGTEDISKKLFWGRTYSDTLGAVQENATLNAIKSNFDKYYYYDSVYLRCAENTNTAKNLRIEKVTVGGRVNDLSDAIRVLFVVTNGAGETKYLTYENRNGTLTDDGALFATILGNTAEIVTVDMYVYFDGKDDSAKTIIGGDAGLLNGQTVEVKFAIDGPDYN